MTRFELITSKEYYETSIALRLWDLGFKRKKAEKLAKKLVNKKFMKGINELAEMVKERDRIARNFLQRATPETLQDVPDVIGNMFKVTCEATNAE